MGAASSSFPSEVDNGLFQKLAGEIYTDSLFNKLSNQNGTIDRATMDKFAKQANDVFLTHDWLPDELDRDNHERVTRVNKALQKRGLKTWFDDDRMVGDLQDKMGEGIDYSCCVVTFVTRKYMDKVDGKGPKGKMIIACMNSIMQVDPREERKWLQLSMTSLQKSVEMVL